MATHAVAKPQWQSYFAALSRHVSDKTVAIEIAGLSLGDQIAADQVLLKGISYDTKNDCFEIATSAIDHRIRHPQDVYVDYGADGLHSVEIVDAEGNQQIVELRSPLLLPSPP